VRLFELGSITRREGSRAVSITDEGRVLLRGELGVDIDGLDLGGSG
jgi:hypothetical protein